jgi:ubiquinone/menaquinone biosynthesis C-methylase UbiE
MRVSDWSGFATLLALIASVVALIAARPLWALIFFLLFLAGGAFTRWWSVRHPGPIPYLLRFTLRIPRRNHSPERLRQLLEPRPGERLLEIGPGLGDHALAVAGAIGSSGALDIFDVQQPMLDDVMRRAERAGMRNIAPRLGSADSLPYPDQTFDGAYLIGVLGEIPDGGAALRELRRVLKPEARLIIGEVYFDSDFVAMGALTRLAAAAGFALDRKLGDAMTYLARFRPA